MSGQPLPEMSPPGGVLPRAARVATATGLFVHAFVFAAWVPRIPEVKASLALSEGELGLALLGAPAGAVLIMWAIGLLVGRVGSIPVIRVSLVVYCAAGVLIAGAGSLPMLFVLLVFWGASGSGLDVAVNAQATEVERRYGRPIMSGLHAAWTAGALVGAALGAAGAAMETSLGWQLAGVGVLGLAIGLPSTLMMLPRDASAPDDMLSARHTPVMDTGSMDTGSSVETGNTAGAVGIGDIAGTDVAVSDRAVGDTTSRNAGNATDAAVDIIIAEPAMPIHDRGCPVFPVSAPVSLLDEVEEREKNQPAKKNEDVEKGADESRDAEKTERSGAAGATADRTLREASDPPESRCSRGFQRGLNIRRGAGRPLGTLCFICLSSFLCEGVAADWSALYLRDVTGASADVAGIGFVLFTGTMLVGRLAGDRVTAAVGAARLVRVSAGITSVVFLSALAVADTSIGIFGGIIGFGIIGVGMACVVPSTISAAGRLGTRASAPSPSAGAAGAAVARVMSFGYVGWLIGPPIVGGLAEMISLRAAMIVVVVLAATVAILAPALSVPPVRSR
ncbi:MFS transporter [Protofrankia symbiont of Coriaria myrtifolia]|uniref:MFS transporter n=1 Tax=Protofrankia symbiont of Coriaria myrtifolia TaxID=1306540 RepID=UPI00104152D0|nr:MFS transporter [Protofrankia symbiont of Coriaria myrtifolia]